ncbi:two-component regulator propeller domain-containing protein [Dokdonella sp.]|uniref:hybrid sensor histidine kinase/response regulator n=1 Tax=Dokdonella sp. TaxID=2291710 RepID=UPI0035285612
MRRFGTGILCWLMPALLLAAPPAADPWFETLRVADGLPSSDVYVIRQAADGFIWIGTRDGMARYDGVDYRVWRHDPDDPDSLASNDVSALLVDRDGGIWAGGEAGGLNQMLDDHRFRRYRHDSKDPVSISTDNVFTIAQDADGTIWVGTYLGGLNRLRDDGSFERIEHDADDPGSLRSTTVISLAGDKAGRLWIGTDNGLDVRERDGRIVHVSLPPLERRAASVPIQSLKVQDDGSVLVGSDHGVARVGNDLAFAEMLVETEALMATLAVVSEPDGSRWIGTTAGLVRDENGMQTRYGDGDALPGDLSSSRVMDILRDREGGLWFALYEGGVARLPARWRNFSVWRHRPGQETSLRHSVSESVSVDGDGGLWVGGGRDGVDHVDAGSGKVVRHGGRLQVKGSPIRSVLQVGDFLWVGHQRGIRRYALDGSGMIELPVATDSPDALPRGYANQLLLDAEGTLWASLRGGGVARIDPVSASIRSYSVGAGALGDADISNLVLDSQGAPWIATSVGVERYNAALDRFEKVPGSPDEAIHAIAFGAEDLVWLHRLGVLERYHLDDGVLARDLSFASSEEWPAMQVSDLHEATDGSLWVASQRGLWRIDADRGSIRQFSERDGLPSAELMGHFARAPDGSVYINSRAGLIGFDPLAISLDSPAPLLKLTGLSVRREGEVQTLAPQEPVELAHSDRELNVVARALSFLNPAGNRYQFRLDGFDEDWVDTGARGERTFSQLPAGDYELQLRAANADGVWSDTTLKLPIHVAAAPWLRPGAWFAYLALFGLVVFAGMRAWRHRLDQLHVMALAEEQRRNAEQLANAKSAFLATMSHEIRTPMTGVLGMAELLRGTDLDDRQRGYAEAISRSGDLLLRLVNDSLDLARIEAGKLELVNQPLDPVELLREVRALEQPLAQKKNLLLELRQVEPLPQAVTGDALRIKQVLLNLVNNAIKFTERGRIELGIRSAAGGWIVFSVSDTGPGMNADMRRRLFGRFEQSGEQASNPGSSGLGLSICRELVDLMGGSIAVDSAPGEGSRFTIRLPLPTTEPTRQRPHASSRSGRTGGRSDNNGQGVAAPVHVLVVEDDATVAAVVIGMLEKIGHRVSHAPHGLAALAILETTNIDLALVDLDLPGIDGLQLSRLLRQRESEQATGNHLPLIAITARATGDEEAQAREAGMDAFLRKPVGADMLEQMMARCLGRRGTPGAADM